MLKYFLLTYALSWSCFAVAIALSGPDGAKADELAFLRGSLLLLGTIAPALVALGLTARTERKRGINTLFAQIFVWPKAARWYVFALGFFAAIKLLAAVIAQLVTGAWPRFGAEPWYVVVIAIVLSTPVQAGEEIGWRGYALPRLAGRFGFARASLVLGLVWAVWHLPLFFVPGIHNYGQSFLPFALGSIALSVVLAWLYAHTQGSLFMTMLMHSAVNQTTGLVPTTVPGATDPWALSPLPIVWIFVALLWISVGYFLATMPKRAPGNFSDSS